MSIVQWIVLAVATQRVAELLLARRNTRLLLAAGGTEHGAAHYPFLVLVHTAWLIALFVGVPANAPMNWTLLASFVALQGSRVWVIASLGRYWTTRIVTLPGHDLVRKGPYRWVRHPNYMIVAAEIATLPLAFGAWEIALVFSLLNAAILSHRIRVENSALAERRLRGEVSPPGRN